MRVVVTRVVMRVVMMVITRVVMRVTSMRVVGRVVVTRVCCEGYEYEGSSCFDCPNCIRDTTEWLHAINNHPNPPPSSWGRTWNIMRCADR